MSIKISWILYFGSVGGPLLAVSCACISDSWLKYKDMQDEMISPWNHLVFPLTSTDNLQRSTDIA